MPKVWYKPWSTWDGVFCTQEQKARAQFAVESCRTHQSDTPQLSSTRWHLPQILRFKMETFMLCLQKKGQPNAAPSPNMRALKYGPLTTVFLPSLNSKL